MSETVLVKTSDRQRFLWDVIGRGTCRSCGAPIVWCRTHKGKVIPVEDTDEASGAVAHFTTCPDAHAFRRSPR